MWWWENPVEEGKQCYVLPRNSSYWKNNNIQYIVILEAKEKMFTWRLVYLCCRLYIFLLFGSLDSFLHLRSPSGWNANTNFWVCKEIYSSLCPYLGHRISHSLLAKWHNNSFSMQKEREKQQDTEVVKSFSMGMVWCKTEGFHSRSPFAAHGLPHFRYSLIDS